MESVACAMDESSAPHVDWQNRISTFAADICNDRLGLAAGMHDRLARSIDAIVHAAADTRFRVPLRELWDTNVDGTRRVLDLASSCRQLARIVVLSTVCTSGNRTGRITETFDPAPPEFLNNYERTKWESERVSLSADLPLGVARVSIVIGSGASGTVHRAGALHHVLKWFARGLIPVVPGDEQTRIDLIATETVARFVTTALTSQFRSGSIWHVAAGDDAAFLRELAEVAFRETRPDCVVEDVNSLLVDNDTFTRLRTSTTKPQDRVIRRALDSINSFLPGLRFPRVYDTTLAAELFGAPLACSDWRRTFVRMLKSSGLRSAEPASAAD
jgi:nucleoside-diphosphate-sugar epimerase